MDLCYVSSTISFAGSSFLIIMKYWILCSFISTSDIATLKKYFMEYTCRYTSGLLLIYFCCTCWIKRKNGAELNFFCLNIAIYFCTALYALLKMLPIKHPFYHAPTSIHQCYNFTVTICGHDMYILAMHVEHRTWMVH